MQAIEALKLVMKTDVVRAVDFWESGNCYVEDYNRFLQVERYNNESFCKKIVVGEVKKNCTYLATILDALTIEEGESLSKKMPSPDAIVYFLGAPQTIIVLWEIKPDIKYIETYRDQYDDFDN